MNNVSKVGKLCCGCGTCSSACPTNCIDLSLKKDGFFRPDINLSKCTNCSICTDICPIVEYPRFNFIENFDTVAYGASKTVEIQEQAASGGMLSEMLCTLIETKEITSALVVKGGVGIKLPSVVWATSREEVLDCKKSVYFPVPINSELEKLKEYSGSVAIVALPCQVQGIRLFQEKYKWSREKIKFVFSLFCNHMPSANATHYLAYNLNVGKLTNVEYRGDGWPGYMSICGENNKLKVPFRETVNAGFGQYFRMHACQFCMDPFGKEADASFADAYFLQNKKHKMKGGQTFIVIRNQLLTKTLKASNANVFNILYDEECSKSYKTLHNRQTQLNYNLAFFQKIYKKIFSRFLFDNMSTIDKIKSLKHGSQCVWIAHKSNYRFLWKKRFRRHAKVSGLSLYLQELEK